MGARLVNRTLYLGTVVGLFYRCDRVAVIELFLCCYGSCGHQSFLARPPIVCFSHRAAAAFCCFSGVAQSSNFSVGLCGAASEAGVVVEQSQYSVQRERCWSDRWNVGRVHPKHCTADRLMLMGSLAWCVWTCSAPKRFAFSFETGCVNVTEERWWHGSVYSLLLDSWVVSKHRLPKRLPAIHPTSSSREIPSLHEYRDDRTKRWTAHSPVSLCLIFSRSKLF